MNGPHEFDLKQREHAIHVEYEKEYFKTCSYIGLSLEEALEIGSLENFQNSINYSENSHELDTIVFDDIKVIKLYVASFIDSIIKAAIKKGVSAEICQSIKRQSYIKLAYTDDRSILKNISTDVAKKMIRFTKNSNLKNYSLHIRQSIEFINNHRYLPILPRDIAQELNVSRSYLSALFTKETTMTITDFIQDTKITTAKFYLDLHTYQPQEISDMLSFSSYSYFCKVFKKHTGISPRDYTSL